DPLLRPHVRGRIALARARAPRSADVPQRPAGDRLLEAVANRPPGTHVLRLFLGPDDRFERRIARDESNARLRGAWLELRDAGDGDVLRVAPMLVPGDVVVELP